MHRGMIIDTSKLHTLWRENADGDVWTYPDGACPGSEPKGFIYQHSIFPNHLQHTCLRSVLSTEVETCDHDPEFIKRTGGWIDGVKGRECMKCNGTQVINEDEEWPEKWDANGSRRVFEGSNGYSVELALAMCRPSFKERLVAASRGFFRLKTYPLDVAIRIAADNCERCMNVLLYKYGQNDGYREFSEEWHRCGTTCHFCEHLGRGDFWKYRKKRKLSKAEAEGLDESTAAPPPESEQTDC